MKKRLYLLGLIGLTLAINGCTRIVITHRDTAEAFPPTFSARVMDGYDQLFTFGDKPGWAGGDGCYTVPLTNNKTLWLFSDTFIGPVIEGKRVDTKMINNSIAVQTGKIPGKTKFNFYWAGMDSGERETLIKPEDDSTWYWLFSSFIANNKLYVFLPQFKKTEDNSAFGFEMVGQKIAEIDNPHDNPTEWNSIQHTIPHLDLSTDQNHSYGCASIQVGKWVYIYGVRNGGPGGRSTTIARVAKNKITQPDAWQFYADGKWNRDMKTASPLFSHAATEFSVTWQPQLRKYIAVYTENGLSNRIMARLANKPQGPWSEQFLLYTKPESAWDKDYFCYSAKAHPELAVRDNQLIITYVCNSTNFGKLLNDARIYRPRFVLIEFE